MPSFSTILLSLLACSIVSANANFPANRMAGGRRSASTVSRRQNPTIAQVLADANILQAAVLVQIAKQLFAAQNAIISNSCNRSAGYTLNDNGAIFICSPPATTTSAASSTTTATSSTTTTVTTSQTASASIGI